MLDALVSEARDRWSLEVEAGIQVVPAETLTAVPIEASRPLLVVPASVLGGPRAADIASVEPLPGRHGPQGRDAVSVLRRLYPADAPVIRMNRNGDALTSIAELGAGDLAGPLYVPPIAPQLAAAGPWSMPFISHRL